MDWLRQALHVAEPVPTRPALRADEVDRLERLNPSNITHIERVGQLQLEQPEGWADSLVFFPDSRSVLVTCQFLSSASLRGLVAYWPIGTEEMSPAIDARPDPVCALSPDGSLVAVIGEGGEGEDLDGDESDGDEDLEDADPDSDEDLENADSDDDTDLEEADELDTDYTVHLWRAADGSLVYALAGLTDSPMAVVFAPDGHTLAALSMSDEICIWSVDSGTLLYTLPDDRTYTDITYLSDGTLAICGYDRQVYLWRPGGEKILAVPAPGKIWGVAGSALLSSIAASSTTRHLALVDPHGRVYIWRNFADAGSPPLELKYHSARKCVFSPDGAILATCNKLSEIRFWDTDTGALLHHITHDQPASSVAFAPNRRVLAVGFSARTEQEKPLIELWGIR